MEKKLTKLSVKILKHLNVRGATLDIFLLPDREIAALKKRFIKKNTEPNVLAFPEPVHFPHPEMKKRYLGEVYLNRDIFRKNPWPSGAAVTARHFASSWGTTIRKPADIKKMEGLEKKDLEGIVT
jgi:ssRNA-specific RNase YbeY (16S rRNA maturation enzyme)